MEQCLDMRKYDNDLMMGIYWNRPPEWSTPDVDPTKAKQLHVGYTPRVGAARYLTHPSLVEEEYVHCPEDSRLVNRAGLDNGRMPEFVFALRILFLAEIGMKWKSRQGKKPNQQPVIHSSLSAYADKLRDNDVDYEDIIAGWIEQERAAGILLSEEESKQVRSRNPEADLRRAVTPEGRDVPPAESDGLSERLSAVEASLERASIVAVDRLGDVESRLHALEKQSVDQHSTLLRLEEMLGKAVARQALFAENEVKVVQLLINIKGQLDDMDTDLQDMLEYRPPQPVRSSPAPIGLVGGQGPQHQAEPQAKAQHQPVPEFKPDVDKRGDFGDAMAFSDMMGGK